MPPKQKPKPKGSAPANRRYKAVEPLQQTTFPEKTKRVTRNHGKKDGTMLARQDTLTQMDWVQLYEKEEQEEEIEDDIQDSEGDYEEEETKRTTKRRKTMGGEQVTEKKKEPKNRRRTLGEEGRTPSFSTQTITQLDYWSLSAAPEEPENDEDASNYDIQVSSPPVVQPPRRSPRKVLQSSTSASTELMPPPQTPKHRKLLEIPSSQSPATPTSSQFGGSSRKRSPLKEQSANIAVPFSLRSNTYKSAGKLPRLKVEDTYDTGTDESQVSRTPSKPSSPVKTVRFDVPDPSQELLYEKTPVKQESTTQRAISLSPMRQRGTPASSSIKLEIFDSDEEEDEDEEVQESQVVTDTPVKIEYIDEDDVILGDTDQDIVEGSRQDIADVENDIVQKIGNGKESDLPETLYGDIGAETQSHVERIMSSSSLSDPKEDTPLSEDIPVSYDRSQSSRSSPIAPRYTQKNQLRATQYTQTQQTQFGKTQYPESQRLSTQQLEAMAPRSAGSDIFISIYPTHAENIISRKKNHEFRSYTFPATVSRIWIYQTKPLSTLTHMAVISSSKNPGEITTPDGIGNAEFNSGVTRSKFAYEILELYALANPMTFEELKSRQWFRAAPQKYARVPPAVLGELIANLQPPLFTRSISTSSLSTAKSLKDVHSTPPPSLHRTSSRSTESQEVQDQISLNIQQFSQAPPSSPPTSTAAPTVHVPSSQNRSIRPSQATTVDYTQTQMHSTPHNHPKESPIPDLIPESPMKSIPSSSRASTPVEMLPLTNSRGGRRMIGIETQSEDHIENEDEEGEEALPIPSARSKELDSEIESQSEGEDEQEEINEVNEETHENDQNTINDSGQNEPQQAQDQAEAIESSPPQPYSLIRSSQFMSRSQMMREQDSLMGGELFVPPGMMGSEIKSWGEVGDSEEEDDDL